MIILSRHPAPGTLATLRSFVSVHALRHPLVALFGAALFLFSASADAWGVGVCAHHAAEHGEHGHADHGHADHGHGELGHPVHDHAVHGHTVYGHDHDHGGHAHLAGADTASDDCPHPRGGPAPAGGDAVDGSAEDASHEHPGCPCGFLCVSMVGPPPVERGSVVVVPGLESPEAPRVVPIPTDDPAVRWVRVPHLLPPSLAPPHAS